MLNFLYITGRIPTEIGALRRLEGLYLYDNEFTGTIPDSIARLPHLKGVYLYNNRLQGNYHSYIFY